MRFSYVNFVLPFQPIDATHRANFSADLKYVQKLWHICADYCKFSISDWVTVYVPVKVITYSHFKYISKPLI